MRVKVAADTGHEGCFCVVVCYKRLLHPGTFGGRFDANFMRINPGSGCDVLPQSDIESVQCYCRETTMYQKQKELVCGPVNGMSQRHDVGRTCLRCVNRYYYVTRATTRAEVNNK